jgi:hypothetical protein
MSLAWNLTDIEDFENRCWRKAPADDPMRGIAQGDRILNPTTHAVIMISMMVGLPTITEKNWTTFYARAHAIEKLSGAYLSVDGSPEPLRPEDIYNHIGLTTNVTRETDAAWRKRTLGGIVEDFARGARRWRAKAQDEALAVALEG